MKSINVTSARKDIYGLLKEVNESHEPIGITSKGGDAVLVSQEDWMAIQETLYLLGMPNLREDLLKGMEEGIEDCEKLEDIIW